MTITSNNLDIRDEAKHMWRGGGMKRWVEGGERERERETDRQTDRLWVPYDVETGTNEFMDSVSY
jgi:hypothetical protein